MSMKYTEKQLKNFMSLALGEAEKAIINVDVPIGAIVVKNGAVIAKGFNEKEVLGDVTAHAEMQAIKKASRALGGWWLEGCDIFVTLEPCLMCFGAMLNARIDGIYYGAYDKRFGAFSANKLDEECQYNHEISINGGILEKECAKLLSDFFSKRRSS